MCILYLVWFIIELPYVYARFFMTDGTFMTELLTFIKQLLFQNTFGASWYITASVQAMLLVWFFDRIGKIKMVWILATLFYVLSCMASMYFGYISNTPIEDGIQAISTLAPPVNSFMVAIIYMLLGKYIAEHPEGKNNKWYQYLIIFFILGIAEVIICRKAYRLTDAFIALVPFTYYLVRILSSSNVSIPANVCKYFRASSTLIYLLHAYILFYAMSVCKIVQGPLLCVIVMTLAITLSILVFRLSKKYKLLKYLY